MFLRSVAGAHVSAVARLSARTERRRRLAHSLTCGAAILAVGVSGCVTVDIPDAQNPTARSRAATSEEAMAYLQVSRAELVDRARTLEGFDAATRLGVGIAVTGAGVSASLESHAAKRVARFMTGGAVSYIANRNVAPRDISRIYRAGVTNLECIRGAAVVATRDTETLLEEVKDPAVDGDVEAAIRLIEADIRRAGELDDPGHQLAVPIADALDVLTPARSVLRKLRNFKKDPGVGERVLSGVNGTLQVVNQLALAQTPDVDAILQSGSAFGLFLNSGATWSKEAQDVLAKLKSMKPVTQGTSPIDAVIADLANHQLQLKVAVARIPDLSIASQLSAINECQTVVEALKPITVSPSPIVLQAGGDPVQLTITGAGPFVAKGLPTGVTFNSSALTLVAADGVGVKEYTIHVVGHGVDSGPLPLKVEAKPKPVETPTAPGTDGPPQTPPPTPGASGGGR
jgi:hypothetical protein